MVEIRKLMKMIAASMLTAALVCTGTFEILPAVTYAASGVIADGSGSDGAEWEDLIPLMLASGEYEEGAVVVGVRSSGDGVWFKGKVRLQAEKLVDSAEDIMTVEAESLKEVTGSGDAAGTSAAAGSTAGKPGLKLNLADDEEDIRLVYIERKDMTTEELLWTLSSDPDVVFAEPNYKQKVAETEDAEDGGGSGNDWVVDPDAEPKDLTAFQWSSFEGAADHAPNVSGDVSMKVPGFGPTGSDMEGEPITIAVLDGPVDFDNPDLKDAAYTFSPEQQAALGCDVHGYNALHTCRDGKLVHWTGVDHGTHCAGIIASSWDGSGVSGVASNVRLISIQILAKESQTNYIDALRGFAFVKRANEAGAGIRITSNSWGDIQTSLAINAAVAELGRKYDVLSVFAAGNDAADLQEIEYQSKTYYDNPYAIVVASTDKTGGLSYFSTYGSRIVTLGAPGSQILSTVGMDNGTYIPDADPAPKFFEGFETPDDPKIEFSQLALEGDDYVKVPGSYAEIVTGKSVPGFAGKNVLRLHLDKDKPVEDVGQFKIFVISMKFGDLAKLGVKKGDYFGFAATSSADIYIPGSGVFINGEDRMQLELKNGDYEFGCSYEWIQPCLRLPETNAFSNLELCIEVWLLGDTDEIFFDSFGFGSQLTAHGTKSGTSMATPAVAGAAAVLASRFRNVSAEELAKITASTVRSSDKLSGVTVTGGILDLMKAPASWPLPEQGGAGSGSQGGGSGANRVLFEKNLPMDNGTGAPFVFDSRGDMETFGPLEAIGGKLYYLPAVTKIEKQPAHKAMYCYNTAAKTWSRLADLPEWLSEVSSAVLGGALYVKGRTMATPDDPEVPYLDDDGDFVCYRYDSGAGAWSKTSSAGLENEETLISDGNKLLLVGGRHVFKVDEELDYYGAVREYDPEKGAGEVLALLRDTRQYPEAEYSDGKIYVFDKYYYQLEVVDASAKRSIALSAQQGAEAETIEIKTADLKYGVGKVLKDALPEYMYGQASGVYTGNGVETTLREGRLVAVPGGVLLLGPNAKDGSGDTYLMKTGETKFAPFGKSMANCKVNSIAATSDGDNVYAIGFAWEEPEKRIFRATALKKPMPPVVKKKNPMTVTAKNKKYKAKVLKKKARSYKALTVKKAKGTVKYKVTYKNKKSKKALKFYKKTGKIKVRKGTRKGTYKVTIKVTAAGNSSYKPATKTRTITVKVK